MAARLTEASRVGLLRHPRDREADRHERPSPRVVGSLQEAAVLAHDPLCDGQAQSGPSPAPGEERLEDVRESAV
jgi:hypothetical protein